MQFILLISSICLILIGGILLYKAFRLKTDKSQQIQKQKSILLDLQEKRNNVNYQLNYLTQEKEKIEKEKDLAFSRLTDLQKDINANFEDRKAKIQEEIKQYKQNVDAAAAMYVDNMQSAYIAAETEYKNKILELKNEKDQVNASLDQVKSSLAAAAAAKLREQEKKQKLNFYKLTISPQDEEDIKLLQDIKIRFHNPLVISKLIWTTYYQKQTTDLCNRILGTEKVCGIYKITDLITDQVYIGQSVDIDRRLKEHIKAGLGIDTTATNVLYKAMLRDGVQNFTFELMQACPKEQLNAKEAYWIDMFSSDKFGLNAQGGNKK